MALLQTPPGELGAPASDFSLPGVDGKTHALGDYAAARVLVVMFICNHCPYVQAVEQRLIRLAGDLTPRGAAFVGVSSNDIVNYPQDGLGPMTERAREKGYTFDYLLDETQEVAKAFGAVCTPDFFVFDAERRLRYRGRLDDSPREPRKVRNEEMRAAILALLDGQPLAEAQNASMGCSIKWKGMAAG